jgi:hypothetical protein
VSLSLGSHLSPHVHQLPGPSVGITHEGPRPVGGSLVLDTDRVKQNISPCQSCLERPPSCLQKHPLENLRGRGSGPVGSTNLNRMFAASEGEVQAQLQEPRTPNRVLNDSQAARRRDRRWTFKVGKEFHVVVRRIEVGVVEHIKRVRFKA